MSRCFPFPPPGYEKKHISEDADLIKEEKRKEKKHKKEKKRKEKGEGKEKKEKDRSDGKHREKKDKKDKHKDKKEKNRDKERDKENKSKDKEKKGISEGAKAAGHAGASSTEPDKKNEHSKNIISSEEKKHTVQLQVQHGQKATQGRDPAGETEEAKFVQELGRRIRDEENGSKGIQLAGRFSGEWKREERMDRVGVKVGSSLAEDKGTNMERSVDNKKMDVQATRNESRFSGNAIASNIAGASKSKIEGMPWAGVRDSGNLAENKMYLEKSFDNRKMDAYATRNEARFSGNAIGPISGFSKSEVEGMPKPLEENNERKEEKEKKTKERGDEKLGKKTKDKDGDKKRHKKDKDQEKEKKKEKSKEKSEHKENEQDRLRDINKNHFTAVSSNHTSELSRDSNSGTAFDVNLKKRKFVTNGSLYENETRPVKMPRPASHEPTQNGNKGETLQAPLNANRQQGAPEQKAVNKEHRMNGAIHGQPLSVPRPKPSLSTAGANQIAEASKKPPQADQIAEAARKAPQADQIAEASRKPLHHDLIVEAPKKPPHPDSKYLSQILTVPKMEEWIECDDQEWLFGNKNPSDRKPGVSSNGVNAELQVWSEARYVESTDIYALPYVIPY